MLKAREDRGEWKVKGIGFHLEVMELSKTDCDDAQICEYTKNDYTPEMGELYNTWIVAQ